MRIRHQRPRRSNALSLSVSVRRHVCSMETLEDRRVLAAVPFAETTVFEGGLSRSQDIGVADFDGDGDLDIAGLSGREVWILFNNGSAEFSEPIAYSTGSNGDSRGLIVEDVTGDGNADLVVGSLAGDDDNALSLLTNDGTGAFNDPVQLVDGMTAGFVEAMDVGDTDGDGDLDLVVGDRGDNRRILHVINQGDGTFAAPVDLDFDSETEPKGVVVTDYDGDGDNDVVVTSSLEDEESGDFILNYVFWFKNNGAGTFSRSLETDTGADPRFLDVADFDQDGDSDIVVPEQAAGQITLYVNGGNDLIESPDVIDAELDEVERTRFVDLDADGDLDIVVTIDGDGLVGWYENTDDVFGAFQVIDDESQQASGLAFGDMNGDGNLDIVSTSQFHATLNLHLNNGDGTWNNSELTGPNAIAPEATLLADFDGDGDADVLALTAFDYELAWYENTDGQGTFDTRDQNLVADYDFSPGDLFWWDVDVGDIDNDGDIDIVTTEPLFRDIVWYQNDGNGNFDNIFTTGEALGAVELEVVDVDGDGDLDLAVGHYFGGGYAEENSYAWYENDGAGEFTPRTISQAANAAFSEIAYGDIDGDGDIDFAIGDDARDVNSTVAWYQQTEDNGEITFEEISFIETDRVGVEDVELADMDGDGDLDAVTASYGTDYTSFIRWYENRDGMGDFSTDPVVIGSQAFVSEIVIADMDNDGDLDVMSPNRFTLSVEWFDNLGDGTFAAEAVVVNDSIITGDTGVTDRVLLIADVGDINGDGRSDIVAPASDQNRIVAFLSSDDVLADPFDLNNDTFVDIADADLLCADIATESMTFDPNGDGTTTFADMEALVARMGSVFGDSNGSGVFGTTDLVDVFVSGEYEDAFVGNSLYSTGDWNCDGEFNTTDLVFVFTLGTYDPLLGARANAPDGDLASAIGATDSQETQSDGTQSTPSVALTTIETHSIQPSRRLDGLANLAAARDSARSQRSLQTEPSGMTDAEIRDELFSKLSAQI